MSSGDATLGRRGLSDSDEVSVSAHRPPSGPAGLDGLRGSPYKLAGIDVALVMISTPAGRARPGGGPGVAALAWLALQGGCAGPQRVELQMVEAPEGVRGQLQSEPIEGGHRLLTVTLVGLAEDTAAPDAASPYVAWLLDEGERTARRAALSYAPGGRALAQLEAGPEAATLIITVEPDSSADAPAGPILARCPIGTSTH